MSSRSQASPSPGLDLLRVPLLGSFLSWRYARPTLQVALGALALVVVLHGLFGPQLAPKNLATLLVWVHWRGLLVLALLLVGNVFCTGCPLLLPRELARRFAAPARRLPRPLRNKWLGLGLLVTVLFVYEWLDLWADPRATALAVVGYFGLALVVDAAFAGAPFCKWICPIGQFNFLSSTLSPFEVAVRDRATCDGCATKDCIRGRRDPARPERVVQRGCELALYLPEKVGNLDCTLCLDCIHACPEDNVAIRTRPPAEELTVDPVRSGIGRLSRRTDVAALAVVFTYGALLNAFAMVSPVYALQRWLAGALGTHSDFVVLSILFVAGLVVAPLVTVGAAAALSERSLGAAAARHARRFALLLVPLGFGVWLAHYGFHFLTGLWTVVPVAQHALEELGAPLLGEARWGLGGLRAGLVWPIEIAFVALGSVGSLAVAWRLCARDFPRRPRSAFVPWAALVVGLAATALWLLAQPMEMRGTYL